MDLPFTLAGANFRPADAKEFIKGDLNRNTVIRLEREPGNQYDSNAIRVICKDEFEEDVFIGYVPKTDNAVLAMHLDNHGGDHASYTIRHTGFMGTIQPTFIVEFDPPSLEERNAAVDEAKSIEEERIEQATRNIALDDEIPF